MTMSDPKAQKGGEGDGRTVAEALEAQLAARAAEADWLKAHYDGHLRAAFAQIASLQTLVRSAGPEREDAANRIEGMAEGLAEEISRLRSEVERLAAAEARYLDRIAELKEKLTGGW